MSDNCDPYDININTKGACTIVQNKNLNATFYNYEIPFFFPTRLRKNNINPQNQLNILNTLVPNLFRKCFLDDPILPTPPPYFPNPVIEVILKPSLGPEKAEDYMNAFIAQNGAYPYWWDVTFPSPTPPWGGSLTSKLLFNCDNNLVIRDISNNCPNCYLNENIPNTFDGRQLTYAKFNYYVSPIITEDKEFIYKILYNGLPAPNVNDIDYIYFVKVNNIVQPNFNYVLIFLKNKKVLYLNQILEPNDELVLILTNQNVTPDEIFNATLDFIINRKARLISRKFSLKDYIYLQFNQYSIFYQYLDLINKSKISYEYNLIGKKLIDEKKIGWDYLHKCNGSNTVDKFLKIDFNQITLNKIYNGYLYIKSSNNKNLFTQEQLKKFLCSNEISKNIINPYNIFFFEILKYVTDVFSVLKKEYIIANKRYGNAMNYENFYISKTDRFTPPRNYRKPCPFQVEGCFKNEWSFNVPDQRKYFNYYFNMASFYNIRMEFNYVDIKPLNNIKFPP